MYLRNSRLLVEKTYNQQKLTPVWKPLNQVGPQQSYLRQRNMLLKRLQHLQKKMIHRIQNLYKLSSIGDL